MVLSTTNSNIEFKNNQRESCLVSVSGQAKSNPRKIHGEKDGVYSGTVCPLISIRTPGKTACFFPGRVQSRLMYINKDVADSNNL